MNGKFAPTRDPELYSELRKAFVEGTPKPTFKELSERFGVPDRTISWRAADEQWNELRAAHMQQQQANGDALSLINQAVSRTDVRLIRAFSDTCILALENLARIMQEIDPNLKPSTRISIIKDASFGFLNLASGSKSVGLVSVERNLEKLGKEDNGRWNPQMLSQINLTIQNLQAKEAASKPAESPKMDLG